MSSMDFLLDARIPALDDYLSGPSQSVLFEVCFWATVYTVYSFFASRVIRSILSKMPFWKGEIRARGGVFCANGQDDIVLMLVMGIHHGVAGYMCFQGVSNNDGNMWRHGYLFETGFEVADILAMVFSMYPYRLDNIKPELKPAMVFHHLPGILFCGIILGAGLNENHHIQEIAFWFLAGAAFSTAVCAATYTMSLATQIVPATILTLANVAFFVYCRFVVFPRESYFLLQDMSADPELNGSLVQKCLQAAGSFFFLFNLAILADLVPKCVRYVKRCFDGVTPIDTEEIPLSREDRLNSRRRSSIMMAIDMVNTTTKQRRSSMAIIMGLNSLQVVHHAEQEVKIRKSLGDKDLQAIQNTMKKMSTGKKD